MGYASRDVVWTEHAATMLDSAVELVAQDTELARDDFLFDVMNAADELVRFADDGRVVPELSSWRIREVFVGRFRLQYHLTQERAEIVALCPRR
jgi:plasmid stabilization system protein ParE